MIETLWKGRGLEGSRFDGRYLMKGIKEKTLIEEHYRELLNIMDTLKVGVFITDRCV